MTTKKLPGIIRLLLAICGFLLIAVLFVPMWRIDLDAPQYPEGLRLLIYPNKLAGNVDIINGLNHYIGMKTMHTADFIEFKILPYIIAAFAALFFIVSILNKRKFITYLFIAFVSFGIIAMIDFWKWEYDYGHDLNPDAAIIVPGMAYQPPLIGFKQLLNFGAYSIPDIGGWLFVSTGLILTFCLFLAYKSERKLNLRPNLKIAILSLFFLNSCSVNPDPLKTGTDRCHYCSMTLSDPKFGAEIVTNKGKIYKYDDIGCLLTHVGEGVVDKKDIHTIYSADYGKTHELIDITGCVIVKNEALHSPMNYNIATFSSKTEAQDYIKASGGEIIDWNTLYH